MSRYEHGRILAVNETKLGSELVAAHAAGVMSLTVEDPVDFDEDGGHLLIADQVIEYSTYDDDTGEITLLSALAADATNSESVWLWDPLYQTITTDLIAEVELDGDDDNTDALECSIAHHLVSEVPEGIRGLRGESVRLEQDGDEWIIVDVLGLAANGASGPRWEADDVYVLTAADVAAGVATCPLSRRPVNESVDARWGVLPQEPSEYTVNYDAQTVTWPLDGFEAVGDRLWFHYQYQVGFTVKADIPIGYEWRYAEGLGSSTIYADPGFDDSTWLVGPSAFGFDDNGPPEHPNRNTDLTSRPMDLWTRVSFTTSGGDLTFSTYIVDDNAWVYLDGALIWSPTVADGFNLTHTVPCAAGPHVVAIRATNDPAGADAWSGFEIKES